MKIFNFFIEWDQITYVFGGIITVVAIIANFGDFIIYKIKRSKK